jgi:hypothetical protein
MGVPLKMLGLLSRKTGETQPRSAKPVLFVTLFGVAAVAHPEILQVILAKFDRRFRTVFCITTDDFSVFVRQGIVCEIFPSVEDQREHFELLDWPSYLTGKWALIIEKWRPTKILAYGMNFDRYMEACKTAARPGSLA